MSDLSRPGRSTVQATTADGVATILIDDGRANVVTPQVLADLDAAIAEAEKTAVAVVVGGRAGRFCAGFDVRTIADEPVAGTQLLRGGVELLLRLMTSPKPIVMACTGHALGFGAFLLLAADRRVGARGEFAIGLPETAAGFAIPPAYLALADARLTPAGLNRVLPGESVLPPVAAEVGYLDTLVEANDVVAAAIREAHQLAALKPAAWAETKLSLRRPAAEAMSRLG